MSGFTPFPETRWTAIRALKSDDSAARQLGWDVVARLYWRPVESYVRLKWRATEPDASDATQSFFAYVLERDTLAKFDPDKARFCTFLRTCLERFLFNEHNAQTAHKRGGVMVKSVETEGEEVAALDPAAREEVY